MRRKWSDSTKYDQLINRRAVKNLFLQLNNIYGAGVLYAAKQGKEVGGEFSKVLYDGNTVNNHEMDHHLFLTLLNPEPLLAQVLPKLYQPSPFNICSFSDIAHLRLLANLSWCLRSDGGLSGFHSTDQ